MSKNFFNAKLTVWQFGRIKLFVNNHGHCCDYKGCITRLSNNFIYPSKECDWPHGTRIHHRDYCSKAARIFWANVRLQCAFCFNQSMITMYFFVLDMYFTQSHEWLKVDGDQGTVGITDHAQVPKLTWCCYFPPLCQFTQKLSRTWCVISARTLNIV